MNNQDDSGLKSSKPETSEDSFNKNKATDQDNNDQLIQINKDSFDDDCNFLFFKNFFLVLIDIIFVTSILIKKICKDLYVKKYFSSELYYNGVSYLNKITRRFPYFFH